MQISTLFVGKTDAPSHAHFREIAEGAFFCRIFVWKTLLLKDV